MNCQLRSTFPARRIVWCMSAAADVVLWDWITLHGRRKNSPHTVISRGYPTPAMLSVTFQNFLALNHRQAVAGALL